MKIGPLGRGIGDGPVAARPLDLLDGGERKRHAIATFAKKLHNGLRSIGHNRRHNNGRWIDYTGIGPEIPEISLFVRPTDEDNTYVDFVRDGSMGNGAARMVGTFVEGAGPSRPEYDRVWRGINADDIDMIYEIFWSMIVSIRTLGP